MNKGEILELEILGLAFGGQGIAKVNIDAVETPNLGVSTFTIFVDGALPEQLVKAKITKKKRRYAEAKLLEILKPSSDEVSIKYQEVPGAPWARLPVEKQLEYKKEQVIELFQKFAQLDLGAFFDEAIPSPEVWNYRNKMEFSFGCDKEVFEMVNEKKDWHHSGFALGSKKRGQYWLVENLERPSGLFDEFFEAMLPDIRKFCEEMGLPVFNQKTGEGFFRYLAVRKSFYEDTFLVNLVTASLGGKKGKDSIPLSVSPARGENLPLDFGQMFLAFMQEKLGSRLKGCFWSQNDNIGDSAQNFEDRMLLYGEEKLVEKINGLEFEISMDSFFQTNPASAERLYNKVVEYAHLEDGDKALDLYCGTGTIGQVLAKEYPKSSILGVEIAEDAVRDAQKNTERNNLKNITFHCADVRKFLKEQTALAQDVKLVVLDPPRAGLSPKALQRALDIQAEHLIYVSCNPATMARDTVLIRESGYDLEQFSIVDQFPHTSHVECIGRFKMKN